jgi:hypothetical protein
LLRFSAHAAVVAKNRNIAQTWIEKVALSPEWTEPDPSAPELTRAFGAIPEAGNRVLRVVYADRAGERLVITVHFDRGALARRKTAAP